MQKIWNFYKSKKTIFGVTEGKLFGHIISKEGITINPKRVKVISQFHFPHNKKSMQSFFRNINFVRKFIHDFIDTIKPFQKMIKKDLEFKWNKEEKEAFGKIKSITAPMLRNHDFNHEFFLCTFSFDQYLVVVLTQENYENDEALVSFTITNRQGAELNYLTIDKQYCVVYKVVIHFVIYPQKSP
jgi:hypothetical protein